MAFLIDQTVINIKLTDKGRELLSRGELTFKKFGIGDSEIDYGFNETNDVDAIEASILRPKDNNPEIVSFVSKINEGDTKSILPSVVSNTSVITNTTEDRGFFGGSSGAAVLYSDINHVKQADAQIAISGVNGGTSLTIKQSPTYGGNIFEPIGGDLLLVRWANPLITGGTVGYNVDENIPYIWYKITGVTGTLDADTLVVEVDRELPDFNGGGGVIQSGALFYPNSNDRENIGTSIDNYYGAPFITDFVEEAVLSFQHNFDTPTIDVPVWNMSIIFTEQVAGVSASGRTIGEYFTKKYGGLVGYFEKLDTTIKNIGLIHYTNNSPSNIYGEGLYSSTPKLSLPTIMWHKKTDGNIGLELTADNSSKTTLTGLNTIYYNLVDADGNIVGKVFNDLKIFIIEDQELLSAMTYKSNRNWTLPEVVGGFNESSCPDSDIVLEDVQVI